MHGGRALPAFVRRALVVASGRGGGGQAGRPALGLSRWCRPRPRRSWSPGVHRLFCDRRWVVAEGPGFLPVAARRLPSMERVRALLGSLSAFCSEVPSAPPALCRGTRLPAASPAPGRFSLKEFPSTCACLFQFLVTSLFC